MAADEKDPVASGWPVEDRVPYPWHARAWSRLTRDTGRLPHALLIAGPSGLNKTALALRLAQSLLCERPADGSLESCGSCTDCALLRAGTHPDLMRVQPPEGKSQITVDQVRELTAYLTLKPHRSARKIVVLSPAEAMNANAANSLLKILEEPPAGSLLMLVSSMPSRLPATVRSRCARVDIERPAREEGVAWLEKAAGLTRPEAGQLIGLAGGSPALALEWSGEGVLRQRDRLMQDLESVLTGNADPVACAARWKAADNPGVALLWLYRLTADLAKVSAGYAQPAGLNNPDWLDRLNDLKNHIKFNGLQLFHDVVSRAVRDLEGPLDNQLILEDVLIGWSRLKAGSSTLEHTV